MDFSLSAYYPIFIYLAVILGFAVSAIVVAHLLGPVKRTPTKLMPFATACCGIELMATGASRHDIARFGAEAMRFSPRQCDLMIVAGRVVMKMVPVMQRIWLQMPEPKWCISMGACASSGGVFDAYATVQGIDRFIPVDIYVPGCPPRPEQLIQSVIDLQEKIQKTGTLTGREFMKRDKSEAPLPLALQVNPAEAVVAPGDFTTGTRLRLN